MIFLRLDIIVFARTCRNHLSANLPNPLLAEAYSFHNGLGHEGGTALSGLLFFLHELLAFQNL